MKYPVIVTVKNCDFAFIANDEKNRDVWIRDFQDNGSELADILCFELGMKWNFAGYELYRFTPFSVSNL